MLNSKYVNEVIMCLLSTKFLTSLLKEGPRSFVHVYKTLIQKTMKYMHTYATVQPAPIRIRVSFFGLNVRKAAGGTAKQNAASKYFLSRDSFMAKG